MNFWLTVLTAISYPELVFSIHSSHVAMCVLTHLRSMRSTFADNVLKKNAVGFAKTFPNMPCVSQMHGFKKSQTVHHWPIHALRRGVAELTFHMVPLRDLSICPRPPVSNANTTSWARAPGRTSTGYVRAFFCFAFLMGSPSHSVALGTIALNAGR